MQQSSFSLTRRTSSHALGILGALFVHALFLQAVTLGASSAKRISRPSETGPGASAILSSKGEWMTLVMVHAPENSSSHMLEEIASRGFRPSNEVVQIISPDPTPAFEATNSRQEDDSAEAAQTVGDPAVQSLLFGRYTGQISARIERAWRRPRSAVDTDSKTPGTFRCQARITQDTNGKVKEIELMSCNGTVEWQQSLVNAIQEASPLPAPASPTVFTHALTLMFEGNAYTSNSPEGDYEPLGQRLARASSNATALPLSAPAPTSPMQTEMTSNPTAAAGPTEITIERE